MPLVNRKTVCPHHLRYYRLSSRCQWCWLIFAGTVIANLKVVWSFFLGSVNFFPGSILIRFPIGYGSWAVPTDLISSGFPLLITHLVQLVNIQTLLLELKLKGVHIYYQYCYAIIGISYFTCWLGIKNVHSVITIFMVTGVPNWTTISIPV